MASYQLDWSRIKTERDIFNFIVRWKNTPKRIGYVQAKSYYYGENWTITHLPDRTYWSDRVITDKDGNVVIDKNGREKHVNAMITNPFVSNNRIAYGIFHDIVAQKVNTLFHDTPVINGLDYTEQYREQFGYSMKKASVEASICGVSFIYEDIDGGLNVFDTENCIPFYEDSTGVLKSMIRFIEITSEINPKIITIAEVYTEEGITKYRKEGSKIEVLGVEPYKLKKRTSLILNEVESISLSQLPIIVFKNNDRMTSDLTPSVRAKIDVIDMVQSGFINNIEDFSDVFWVIKSQTQGSMTADDYADFFANINRTKRIFAEDATPEQFSIPHEARSKAIEMLKQEIIEESGVIDTNQLTATQLTTTAIKAATMKLEQRVSDFEWFANESCRAAVYIYFDYNGGGNVDFDIDFVKLIINNTTEVIDNMIKVQNDLSLRTRLTILQKVGMIKDVDEELALLEKEAEQRITLLSDDELGGVDAGTQEDTEDANATGESTSNRVQ